MFTNITFLNSKGEFIIRCAAYTKLSTTGAFTVSRAPQRFRHLDQYSFRWYPESVEIEFRYGKKGNPFFLLNRELGRYGPLINEITFSGTSGTVQTRQFLGFVEGNFWRWKVKCLKFVDTEFELDDVVTYGNIFENVEKIELNNCIEYDDGAYEAIIMQCKQLKALTLIDLKDFDGSFLPHATPQLESLHLQNVIPPYNNLERYSLKLGSRIESLILRHVSVVIECPSRDLSKLHTLKLCLIRSNAPSEILCYTGDQLKHLHLAKINSDGSQIRTVGKQLEKLSLLKCPNFRCEHIFELLRNNKNLRSVKLCNVGNESLFREVPRRATKLEQLCIWPAREDNRQPINFDDIVQLPRLKAFAFLSPKYSTQIDVLANLIEQLTRIESLQCVGLLMRPQDLKKPRFKEKFFQFEHLKSLKLVIWGPQSFNQKIAVEIATHFADLAELKILNNMDRNFDDFHDTCCCNLIKNRNKCFLMEITSNQFAQILRARKRVQARVPLKIYQSQGPHKETARLLENQSDAHKNVLQLLPLEGDGFFNFFTADSIC